jgi:dTDP-4-dehydrorhamnose reductase
MRVMVLGATGMLGYAMFRVLSAESGLSVYGTARSENSRRLFSDGLYGQVRFGVEVENHDNLIEAFSAVRPDVVVNCVGLVKQHTEISDPLRALPINALLPHRLAALCLVAGARLVHISTDCVFSGARGDYRESDFPDADDLYGRSKLLGEVDCPHAITLRTSIVGHELTGQRSLLGWFLAQQEPVRGFARAIFSGLPTGELARVVLRHVLPQPHLHGLYHVASRPISKLELLQLIARTYGKEIEIIPSDEVVINRSLNAERFNMATGYAPADWPDLVQRMYEFK